MTDRNRPRRGPVLGLPGRARPLQGQALAEETVFPLRMLLRYAALMYRGQGRLAKDVAGAGGLTRQTVTELEQGRSGDPRMSTVRAYLTGAGLEVTGFGVKDPRAAGAVVVVGIGPQPVPSCVAGTPFPGRPGFVVGRCSHPVDELEWLEGYDMCERCEVKVS